MLKVVEKFVSLSGEAPVSGFPSFFIRFSHCNLECSYCDTEYKDEVAFTLSEEDILQEIDEAIKNYPNLKIFFTGGEPLLNERQKKNHFDYKKAAGLRFLY